MFYFIFNIVQFLFPGDTLLPWNSSLWDLDKINLVEFYAIWHDDFCLKQINLPTLFCELEIRYKSL